MPQNTPQDDARLEQQLRRITRSSSVQRVFKEIEPETLDDAAAAPAAETEELTAAWRAFGELLEAAQPAAPAVEIARPLRRRLFYRRMRVGAALAATLLVGMVVLRSGLSGNGTNHTPAGADIAKSPGVPNTPSIVAKQTSPAPAANAAESNWDTTFDTEVAEAPAAAEENDSVDTGADVAMKLFDRQVASLSSEIESSSL